MLSKILKLVQRFQLPLGDVPLPDHLVLTELGLASARGESCSHESLGHCGGLCGENGELVTNIFQLREGRNTLVNTNRDRPLGEDITVLRDLQDENLLGSARGRLGPGQPPLLGKQLLQPFRETYSASENI